MDVRSLQGHNDDQQGLPVMTPKEMDAIEARARRWMGFLCGPGYEQCEDIPRPECGYHNPDPLAEAVPALVAYVRELEAERDRLRDLAAALEAEGAE